MKSDDVVAALEAELGQLTSGYAMTGTIHIAEQVASDFAAASESYLALASDASVDPLSAATLLSVMVAPKMQMCRHSGTPV